MTEREKAEEFVRKQLDRVASLCSAPGGADYGTYMRALADSTHAELIQVLSKERFD